LNQSTFINDDQEMPIELSKNLRFLNPKAIKSKFRAIKSETGDLIALARQSFEIFALESVKMAILEPEHALIKIKI
jgi:hypothetical protein